MFVSAEVKHHYLCALSHLLQWIPKQVLLLELPNVSNNTSLMNNHLGHSQKKKSDILTTVVCFSTSVDASIGSIFVLWGTEFEAVHITDNVLTSVGCSRDYHTSRDVLSSHALGIVKVSDVNGNLSV